MYNPEVKNEYLQTIANASRRNAAEITFNALEKHETKLESDICTLGKEELKPILTEINGLRTHSIRHRMSILREYVSWCRSEGKFHNVSDAVFEIDELGLDKFRNQMIVNPSQLSTYLDCIYDDVSEETKDCVFRCYFWLAFCGFPEERIEELKCSDFDSDLGAIIHDSTEYEIEKEGIDAIFKCATLKYFVLKHPNYEPIRQNRFAGDRLLRGVKADTSLKNLRSEASRRQKDKSKWHGRLKNNPSVNMALQLSYGRVKLSGLFYRQYIAEQSGVEPDFMDAALLFMGDYDYQLKKSRNTLSAKQRQVAKDYMDDYIKWKKAYEDVL